MTSRDSRTADAGAAAEPSPLRRTLQLLRPHLPGSEKIAVGGILAILLEVCSSHGP